MKQRIRSIKCPHCRKRYMILKVRLLPATIIKDREWYCLNCPAYTWEESWFNEFTHYEHLIEREVISGKKGGKYDFW